ncbi:MAG: DUF4838 domain-containing protein [Candidatus Sumerlaeia bacterium]|nr:DUF4838 domain-containing protein [Candidatus Sumerlaeia bacterium]
MMRRVLAAVLAAMVLAPCVGAAAVLVRDGRPASVIVLADKPTRAARAAANELQMWIEKISGARIPIRMEKDLPPATNDWLILVGDTHRTRALGLDPAKFALEEIRIQTFPGALVLIGDDERPDGVPLEGTLWAVEQFAEDHLGVRVLWPGELGLVVPKKPTLEIGEINFRHVPVLRKRTIRNIGYSDRIQTGLDKLGWKAEDFKRHIAGAQAWFRFHRIGGSYNGNYGHAYGSYWARFSKTHPEWFALQPDGTRDNTKGDQGRRAQLCVSNRSLIEHIARECIEQLRKDPTKDCVSISPNDGSAVTHCLCKECEAWDAPEGEIIEMWGPNERTRHVSLSDRYVRFYSEIAALVARELPDRYLGAYAYSVYRTPPLHAKLHPNIVLGFVGFDYLNEVLRQKSRDHWLKWAESARQIFLRPNALMAAMGHPTFYGHRLADDIRFCLEHGMIAADFDCCYQHWAGDGLNYYVLAKVLWNPQADVDAIVRDYCRAGFGPAADAVREYFAFLEDKTAEFARSNASQEKGKSVPALFAEWCTDDYFARCNALLDAAAKQAAGQPTVLERVAFLRKAVEMAQLRREWLIARSAGKAGNREASQKAKQLQAKLDRWYQERLGLSWALNAASLKFYGY